MRIFGRLALVVLGATLANLLLGQVAGYVAAVVLVAAVYDLDD